MADPVILIHTVEGVDAILAKGGSGYWRANQWRWKDFRYVGVCQNYWKAMAMAGEWDFATGKNPHNSLFMIGRIKELIEASEAGDDGWRGTFLFSEYALIEPIPDIWPSLRHPLYYGFTLEDIGIDLEQLTWQPMPPPSAPDDDAAVERSNGPVLADIFLTDLKRYAAERLGVLPHEVEVSVTLHR